MPRCARRKKERTIKVSRLSVRLDTSSNWLRGGSFAGVDDERIRAARNELVVRYLRRMSRCTLRWRQTVCRALKSAPLSTPTRQSRDCSRRTARNDEYNEYNHQEHRSSARRNCCDSLANAKHPLGCRPIFRAPINGPIDNRVTIAEWDSLLSFRRVSMSKIVSGRLPESKTNSNIHKRESKTSDLISFTRKKGSRLRIPRINLFPIMSLSITRAS